MVVAMTLHGVFVAALVADHNNKLSSSLFVMNVVPAQNAFTVVKKQKKIVSVQILTS